MANKILVIGAGAAGLMAACAAAEAGADVTIYEQNEKAGKKIYITGKGRCNYTNVCDTTAFLNNVVHNPKFLYSAVYGYDSTQVTALLEANGCLTKVERGERAFPASDHASDVTKALVSCLRRRGGRIVYNTAVQRLLTAAAKEDPADGKGPSLEVTGIRLANGQTVHADAVIVATGGLSYPSTGSTGDGHRWAERLGMAVTPCSPSLVPLETREDWPRSLQGLALKNVAIKVLPVETGKTTGSGKKQKKIKPLYEGFGEMLFTHFGVSGPLVLSASCHLDQTKYPAGYILHLDLKPALTAEQLEARLLRELEAARDKALVNVLRTLLPGDLPRVIAQVAGIEGTRAAHTINERELKALAAVLKDLPMTITGTRGFNEAIVTKGGISVKEINPSTMECKKIRGLYFAGEIIDVDAYTGGFNLQIAWSTGHLAGLSAAST